MSGALQWRPLAPFGATIDLDLKGSVSGDQIDALRELFDRRHLLLFTGQSLSAADQRRVCGWFGPVEEDKPASRFTTEPEMGALGAGELAFHSDMACTPAPLIGLSLLAIEVEERSSTTMFVDAMAAARDLPEILRRRIEGLHVMNLWPSELAQRQRSHLAPAGWPGAAHPVLKPHPRTGEPILYLNANQSDRIVELEAAESEDLIQALFQRLYAPAHRYEHHWRNGDFIVWDNLALQHARKPVPPGVVRTLQRVEIGACPWSDMAPEGLVAGYRQA